MPASAIIPIIAVAVNSTGSGKPATSAAPALSSQNPGMMPITVSGIASMMIAVSAARPVCTISTTKMPSSAAANAIPRSRNTRTVISHSPSPVHTSSTPGGSAHASPPPASRKVRASSGRGGPAAAPRSPTTSATISAGARPATSANT